MKRESLADRLIRVCEEKAKLECENQKLMNSGIALKQSNERLLKILNELIDDKSRIFNERHDLFMENLDLRSYNSSAKLCFEHCGAYIVNNSRELGISDFIIKDLGLINVITGNVHPKESSNNDDILSLFKQSSNHI